MTTPTSPLTPSTRCTLPVSGGAVGLLVAVGFLGSAQQAHAYTDPGTGALLWQMLMAGAVGSMFYVRRVFHWVRNRKRTSK